MHSPSFEGMPGAFYLAVKIITRQPYGWSIADGCTMRQRKDGVGLGDRERIMLLRINVKGISRSP